MAVPPVVLVVPLFLLMVNVGLINTLPSVIVVYTGAHDPDIRVFADELLPGATL